LPIPITEMKKPIRLSKMAFHRSEHFVDNVLPAGSSLCLAQAICAPNSLLSFSPPPLSIYLLISIYLFIFLLFCLCYSQIRGNVYFPRYRMHTSHWQKIDNSQLANTNKTTSGFKLLGTRWQPDLAGSER